MASTAGVIDTSDHEKGLSRNPTLKESNASIHSASLPEKAEVEAAIPTSQLPGSTTFKTVLLVFTMTMVMIVNVRRLSLMLVTRRGISSTRIFTDGERHSCQHLTADDRKRAPAYRRRASMDRIGTSSQLG